VFGEFEDLETGEKNEGNYEKMDYDGKTKYFYRRFFSFDCLDEDEEEGDGDTKESKLQAKKAKLKSAFDAEYDQSKDPDSGYLDELKKEVDIQTKVIFPFSRFHFSPISFSS
jgi:hypothetical protein